MKKFVLITFLLIPIISFGQERIKYMDFPKNSISVAPTNIFFDGNGNTSFYKRLLSQSEDKLKYLRIGTDFFGTFKAGEQKGTKNFSFNVGLEKLKKLQSFSLSFGYELALDYYSADGRHVEPNVNTIFFPQSNTTSSSSSTIDRGTFFLTSIIGFIGIKYHLTKHFSLGLESAAGAGYFRSIDKMLNGDSESSGGVIMDIDPSRHFTVEYYF